MRVTSSLATALTPTTAVLGNFDGVHRGHQQVIQVTRPVMSASRSLDLSTQELNSQPLEPLHRVLTAIEPDHSYLTVVAFDPHPQEFFTGRPRALLTPLSEKRRQLENLGVEQLVLLPFNAELACLSPEAFVQKILVQQLAAQAISVGFNFRFGYQRAGTAMALAAIAAPYNIQVTVVPPQTYEGEQISSSAIRQALQSGNLQQANRLLGRSYSLIGTVVQGQQLGRTLGFPTANLQLPPEKFLPCQGVYSVRVESPELEQAQIGVMNLGYRPTIEGASQTIEVHLLDWSGDLYGQTLTVYLEQFLRPEQKFSSLEALKTQIQADCAAARSFLNSAA